MNNGTANTVGEFASVCGDATLAEKTYGGHILIAWRRDASTAAKEEAFGLNFGAKASDATIQAEVGLSKLVDLGFDQEELLIEVKGLPVPTAVLLPNGNMGYSVKSVLDYLNTVSAQASSGTLNFLSVVDYKLERQQVWQMDLCIPAGVGITHPCAT